MYLKNLGDSYRNVRGVSMRAGEVLEVPDEVASLMMSQHPDRFVEWTSSDSSTESVPPPQEQVQEQVPEDFNQQEYDPDVIRIIAEACSEDITFEDLTHVIDIDAVELKSYLKNMVENVILTSDDFDGEVSYKVNEMIELT